MFFLFFYFSLVKKESNDIEGDNQDRSSKLQRKISDLNSSFSIDFNEIGL